MIRDFDKEHRHPRKGGPPASGPLAIAPMRPARISTELLMGGRREIVLQHGPDEYRLRVTSSGKLILTK